MFTEFFEFVSQSEVLPFSVALVLMLGIGIVSGSGIDYEPEIDPGVDLEAGADSSGIHLIDWINPGRMPIMAAFSLFLLIYGLMGYAGQQLLEESTGAMLPWVIAAVAVFLPAYVTWNAISRIVGRIMPRDYSEATRLASLVRTRGTIQIGTATHERRAQAMFVDHYGTKHYLMVRMAAEGEEAEAGSEVYLLEQGDDNIAVRAEARQPFAI